LLRVRTTNDKILQTYYRLNNDNDDGIYFNELDRNSPPPSPAGTEIIGTLIIRRSDVFPQDDLKHLLIDTNHLDNPSGYITSLCFATQDNNNNSTLFTGRVRNNTSTYQWTQCNDSPKTYNNKIITEMFSSFLTTNNGTPVKILNLLEPGTNNQTIILEHH